jgi:diguanylate cyclase (GGDEF)-like protein
VAVSNARAVAEMERRKRESDQLEKIGRALTASLDIDEVLQRVVTAIRDLVQADGAGVWFLRPDNRAEIVMSAGNLALPPGTEIPVPPELAARLLRDRQPLVVDRRTGTSPEVPIEILDMLHAQSAIGVPLVAEGELVGALSVSHMEGRSYSPDDVRLLERFAVHAAISVANARLHEKVRLLSLTDPLTELPNRRQMSMLLEKEFAAAERGRTLAIVLFDLDDFKLYNDTAGHQAGDEILRRFARVLERETRAMNLAARYGGDEFICILSDTDHEGGAIQAGRVMRAMRADDMLSSIGVSAGVAVYDPSMESPQDLIRLADRDLYSAKSKRRGEVPTR